MRFARFIPALFFGSIILGDALAADIPAYVFDTEVIDTQAERDKIVNVVQALFDGSIQLQSAQRLYCSRSSNGDHCTLEEAGTCTRQQFANAKKAGHDIEAMAVNGDTVAYRRVWQPSEITDGAKRTAVVAYLMTVHPDITLQFMLDFSVMRQSAEIISKAAYLTAVAEEDLAQLDLEKKLIRVEPEE